MMAPCLCVLGSVGRPRGAGPCDQEGEPHVSGASVAEERRSHRAAGGSVCVGQHSASALTDSFAPSHLLLNSFVNLSIPAPLHVCQVSEQWFVRMEPLARPALKAVQDKAITIMPERFEKVYFNWLGEEGRRAGRESERQAGFFVLSHAPPPSHVQRTSRTGASAVSCGGGTAFLSGKESEERWLFLLFMSLKWEYRPKPQS